MMSVGLILKSAFDFRCEMPYPDALQGCYGLLTKIPGDTHSHNAFHPAIDDLQNAPR
jgi:hypothetical protein